MAIQWAPQPRHPRRIESPTHVGCFDARSVVRRIYCEFNWSNTRAQASFHHDAEIDPFRKNQSNFIDLAVPNWLDASQSYLGCSNLILRQFIGLLSRSGMSACTAHLTISESRACSRSLDAFCNFPIWPIAQSHGHALICKVIVFQRCTVLLNEENEWTFR